MTAFQTAEADFEGAPTPPSIRSTVLRTVAMVALVTLCATLLGERLAGISGRAVLDAIAAMPAGPVLAALVFGALSHAALSGYDLLAFARIGVHVPWSRALKGGFAGTVFSQVLGLGLITGSFARTRIYRANDVTVPEALALSGFVAAGFLSGLAVLLAVLTVVDSTMAAAVLGVSEEVARAGAGIALLLVAILSFAARGRIVQVPFAALTIRVPDGRWLAGATALAAADLVPAALCLSVLLPAEGMPPLAEFVAVYVVAVALGHMIGSPGAVGPFEGIMFLAFPQVPAADLAAAVLVYRAVYYLPPFTLAVFWVAAARQRPAEPLVGACEIADRIDWVLDEGADPEGELAHLGDKRIFFPARGRAFLMYGISGRIWLVMGDPQGPQADWPTLADAFERAARAAGARVAVYKLTGRARAFWAGRGYRLQPLGEEGAIDAQAFTLDGPARRELRRKLAQVRKAGVAIAVHEPGEAPLAKLAPVAEAWAAEHGREQTFSMGHWDPAFARHHVIAEARVAGRPVAFVSIWRSGDGGEWMLDLMRSLPDTPNGTMHALIVASVEAARAAGAARFNLCLAPLSGLDSVEPVTGLSRLGQWLFARNHDLQGLRRFKEVFRPDWQPRHLAAWTLPQTLEALLAARRLIEGRGPLNARGAGTVLPARTVRVDHPDDEDGVIEAAA